MVHHEDRKMQFLPEVCCGSRSSRAVLVTGWKHHVHLGSPLRRSLGLPSRPDLLVLSQSGSLSACLAEAPCLNMPCYSCATRLFALLQAGLSSRVEGIGSVVSCAHGCSRNHPVSSAHTQPARWLLSQCAWGTSSSEPTLCSYQSSYTAYFSPWD